MAWSIGILLGESALEIVGVQKDSGDGETNKKVDHRVCMAQGTLESLLTQFLSQNDIKDVKQLRIVSPLPLRILEAAYGTSTTFITTAGFEHWLEMTAPLQQPYYTSLIKRQPSYIERDFFFGVKERTNAQGHIEKLLDESELEFLISKLELHGIKSVAVGFLHSHLNPENENRARQILEERGFKVFLSSKYKDVEERPRFWSAILNSYVSPLFIERMQIIETAFRAVATPDADFHLGPHALGDVISGKVQPLETAFSFTDYMAQRFAKTSHVLYCGLEEFLFFEPQAETQKIWSDPHHTFAANHIAFKKMRLQPLMQLGRAYFSELTFCSEKITFDPGPVVFGRGLIPTLFDLLTYRQECENHLPSCVLARRNDRGILRLKETLEAYARNLSGDERISAEELENKLLKIATDSWRCDLGETQNLILCGPLAPIMKKHINGQVIGDDFFTTTALLVEDPAQ